MIKVIITICFLFFMGVVMANLIRLEKVKNELKREGEEAEKIKDSENSEDIKNILLEESMKRLKIIGKFNYFMW